VLVYDAAAVYHRRIDCHATRAVGGSQAAGLPEHTLERPALETSVRARADFVTCISPAEEAAFRATEGTAPIALVPLSLRDVRFTERRHRERSGIAFVAGWLGGSDSPNTASLIWFMSEVMPLVTRYLPTCLLTVTGDCPAELIERFREWAVFPGRVPNLASVYDEIRVAVVPIRCGTGAQTKTVEALQYGVPVVSTTAGAEGLPAPGLDAVMIADDPVLFAERVASLYAQESQWNAARDVIRTFVTARNLHCAGAWVNALDRAQLTRSSTPPD
jgi:hypothetical protein